LVPFTTGTSRLSKDFWRREFFGGYVVELQSHATLAHVFSKLPHTLRSRWKEYSYAIMDRLPDLSDLDNWLDNCAIAEYYVRAGSDRTSTPAAFGKDRQEQKGGR
jgi:hypothetical protein